MKQFYPLSPVQSELLRRVVEERQEKERLIQAIAHESGVPDGAEFTGDVRGFTVACPCETCHCEHGVA